MDIVGPSGPLVCIFCRVAVFIFGVYFANDLDFLFVSRIILHISLSKSIVLLLSTSILLKKGIFIGIKICLRSIGIVIKSLRIFSIISWRLA